MTAQQAIERSIANSETVTLGTATSPAEGAEAIKADLFVECDDCSDTGPGCVMAEYWGSDESGNTWRVHVWFR